MIEKFNVVNQHITHEKSMIASGTKNYLEAEFTFSEEWEGTNKIAIFTNYPNKYPVILVNDKCIIPWEV